MTPEFISVKELAARLGLKKHAVLKHVRLGNLPATRIGNIVAISADDATEFERKRANRQHVWKGRKR
jgi:excisionase family DNA binding protein